MKKNTLITLLVLPIMTVVYVFIIEIAEYFSYDLFGLSQDSKIGFVINFFIHETIKIMLLLFGISFLMGIINAYFPIDRLKNFLTTRNLFGLQYFFASLFGAVTPFCSCSSIPLFMGFIKGGIPLGVTFSFLITSPLVNEVAIALFLGSFGWKATLIYVTSGILLGMIGGLVMEKLKLEHLLADWVVAMKKDISPEQVSLKIEKRPISEILNVISEETWKLVYKVSAYILVGIGIGAYIYGFVPEGFFEEYITPDNPFAVPLAVILAVPMYAGSATIIPIIQVFVAKGIPLGTAIAFMMGVVGLSLPEATMLKKVMTWKLIAIFFGMTESFMILSGYLFNLIL
jgi:uncharacterized membrane protein YraQ (UPF0718 family)